MKHTKFIRKLPTPQQIKDEYPVPSQFAQIKTARDTEIRAIIEGVSDKFLLVIGPCSADRQDSILMYLERLCRVAEQVKDKIVIVPRVFTNKPRTTGVGYMGMLHQPDPKGVPDLLSGVISIRSLHLKALVDYGFTCADEMLYPENYRYLSDLLSYVTVGARSVENQFHRLVASGLDIPVGMKNPISGNIKTMINAVNASRISHTFLYRGWEVITDGNMLSHAVLRGYVDSAGNNVPNYCYADLCEILDLFHADVPYQIPIIVDTNHSNSNKEYLKQIDVALDVMRSRSVNSDIKRSVKGLMIESYLKDGRRDVSDAEPGISITDACLGWEKTESLIYKIAETL